MRQTWAGNSASWAVPVPAGVNEDLGLGHMELPPLSAAC